MFTEVESEVKTVIVEIECSCKVDGLKYAGERSGYDPYFSFMHKCDHCGSIQWLDKIYPHIKYEKV